MPLSLPVSILAGLEVRSRLDKAVVANRATTSPTGHAHITGPSGNDREFKFKAGFKAGENAGSSPHGEIVYIDDGFACSFRMKSISVTGYLEKGPNSRRIQGPAEINGHHGTYQLDVTTDDSATDNSAIRFHILFDC